jgi:hypothetical protein
MTSKLAVGKLKSGAPRRKGGRPPGSLNKRTVLREALQASYPEGEAGFWKAVVKLAEGGDIQAMTMIADRLMPKLKPQGEFVTLDGPMDGSPADVGRAILRAISSGQISADAGRELLAAVADLCKIVETTELMERVQRLEEATHATH